LVFDFVQTHLQDDYDRVRELFRGRGAYRRYKDFLEDKDMLDTWYDFEHAKTLEALREWAEGEGVEVDES
jgi:hypothetical protein